MQSVIGTNLDRLRSIRVSKPWLKSKKFTGTRRQTDLSMPQRSWLVPQAELLYRNLPEYDDDYRHWSPTSEAFASAEVLLQYLRNGWQFQDSVIVRTFRCFSRRCVRLYYFSVVTDGRFLTIPVLENPVVLRLIHQYYLKLIDFSTEDGINISSS